MGISHPFAAQAKARQLHNKVVFLKSSLEMELEAKVALEKDLVKVRQVLGQERAEYEQRLAEAARDRDEPRGHQVFNPTSMCA